MEHIIEQDTIEKALLHLPSYARVALGLASVERAATLLRTDDDHYPLIHRGLEDGWKWVGGGNTKCQDLYEQIDPLAHASMDFEKDTAPRDAMLSVVACLYYATGEIATYQTEEAPPGSSPLGSDMADVGPEDLVECLTKASEVAENTEAEVQWQQEAINRLLSDFHVEDNYQLGPPLNRAYFQS